MALATYSDLKTSIANFLARDDLTSNIDDFIDLTEARLSRELYTRFDHDRVTASTTAGDQYISLTELLCGVHVSTTDVSSFHSSPCLKASVTSLNVKVSEPLLTNTAVGVDVDVNVVG